ncbi:hypothetical protein [Streptomyces sp. NPDC050585]|uniref:hypothetical protein n=1 Tax=Streptomyces sp. NPDC050585 TaxID=3365632 RepID=UPI0037A4E09C
MIRRGALVRRPLLAAAVLALSIATCSAPTAGSPPQASTRTGAPEPGPAELRRLADGLNLAPRTRQVLHEAESALVRECMAEKGFASFHEPLSLEAARATEENRTRELSGDDVDRARREAFGTARPQTRATDTERREAAYLATLSPARRDAWVRALHGDPAQRMVEVEVPGVGTLRAPTDGCFASARTGLYGDYEKWVRADTFVTSRYLPVNEAVRKEPAYVRATQRWSACMRANGHHFADPGAAARSAGATGNGPAAVRLAVSSAVCDRQTGRSRTHRELFRRQTLQWVREHHAEALDFTVLNRQAAGRATALTTAR